MIPKLVHITWKNTDILKSNSPLIQNGILNLIKLNPDWEVNISTDDEVNEYLYTHMESQDFKLIENDKIVPKTDIWRLIKLYLEGGVYTDIDRYCNVSFSKILLDQTKCVLPTCLDYGFSHDFMMSEPKNPIYLETYKLLIERRKETHNVYFLGPQTYMHSVTKCLTGTMIDINPDIKQFQYIRETISQYPFIVTYREELPYDSIMYKEDNGVYDEWEKQKRKLYHDFGLKHWTGEW
jgi:hypothetical protein